MKNKFEVVFKKLQSYSFIIFIVLIVATFIVIAALNKPAPLDDEDTTDNTPPVGQKPGDDDDKEPGEVVDLTLERFLNPAAHAEAKIIRDYWDLSLSTEMQERSLININNRYEENKGWQLSLDGESTFDVVASLSGEVVKVDEDDFFGSYVVIEHELGIETRYYSLSNIQVEVGQKVERGETIAEAGTNFDTESGVHVYFEIALGNKRLNPHDMIGQKLKDAVNT